MRKIWCGVCVSIVLAAVSALPAAAQTAETESQSVLTIIGQRKKAQPVQIVEVRQAGNLRSLANAAGYTGTADSQFVFVVPEDVTIMGTPNGGTAIDSGEWPQGVTLALAINGKVYGGGGKGGDGGPSPLPQSGTKGGDAIVARAPLLIVVAETGAIESGGGGGGGGGDSGAGNGGMDAAGGGGGGGFPNGLYGVGGISRTGSGDSGQPGRIEGGGRGGNNTGMSGSFAEYQLPSTRPTIMARRPVFGGYGGMSARPGQAGGGDRGAGGGEPGFAIRANGNPVELHLSGRMRGDTD